MNDKHILFLLRYFIIAVIFSIILIGSIFVSNILSWIIGAIFGSINSIILFLDLKRTMELAVEMDVTKAQSYAFGKYMFRFLITGVIIYISIKSEYINVVSTILGLTSIKMAILMRSILLRGKGDD